MPTRLDVEEGDLGPRPLGSNLPDAHFGEAVAGLDTLVDGLALGVRADEASRKRVSSSVRVDDGGRIEESDGVDLRRRGVGGDG